MGAELVEAGGTEAVGVVFFDGFEEGGGEGIGVAPAVAGAAREGLMAAGAGFDVGGDLRGHVESFARNVGKPCISMQGYWGG